MGLFRTAVVVGVAVALMPTDRGQQSHMAEQVAAAAKWTVTYCDRNPQTCDQAAAAWAVFLKKAEFAGKLAYDVAQEHLARAAAGDDANRGAAKPAASREGSEPGPSQSPITVRPVPAFERGTLSKDDLRPAWRGRPGA